MHVPIWDPVGRAWLCACGWSVSADEPAADHRARSHYEAQPPAEFEPSRVDTTQHAADDRWTLLEDLLP